MSEYTEPIEEKPRSTPFNSPKPFFIRLRNLVFGRQKPDIYTLSTFYVNLIICVVFATWEILSVIAITSRELIWQQKNIPIEAIINERGEELGFAHGKFLDYLSTVHSIGLICWLLFFIGLALLYRKNRRFIYFTLVPLLFYVGMLIFYLNFTYFIEDTTAFDKVALLVAFSSLLIHYFLMRSERKQGSINFFGLSETDEADEIAP
jgi:hypothetical protein